jgi:hypothetical protein
MQRQNLRNTMEEKLYARRFEGARNTPFDVPRSNYGDGGRKTMEFGDEATYRAPLMRRGGTCDSANSDFLFNSRSSL